MLFQNKSTDPCSLTQQVEDLRKIIRQTNWHTHNVRLSLHCKDGDPTRFLFRDLYTVYAIGEDTIFIEAATVGEELIKDDFSNIRLLVYSTEQKQKSTN